MTFEHPGFFLLALLVPLMIGGAILASRARGRAWQRLVAERLRPLLVRERRPARRWITFALFLLAFLLLIAALAAPNAGYRETEEIIRGRNILLAVDVSRSMLARDESPSRISAARAAALEILDRFPNDRVGIIAFSEVAWLQAPLTIDHDALRQTFQQLDFQDSTSEWLPRGGSNLAGAVKLAAQTVRPTGHRDNSLVILSDGEAHSGDLDDAADDAAEIGLTIFAAGFGTKDGAFVPDPEARDGNLHDRDGNLVVSRLEEDSLRLLARRTGGFYTKGSGSQFSSNLEVAVQRMQRYELEGRSRLVAIPRFPWFLAPSMVLFVVGMLLNTSWRFGRPAATAALAALLGVAAALPGRAAILPPTAAQQAYADGDHERALALFEQEVEAAEGERRSRLQLGVAAAAYRLQQFSHASRAFSGALLSNEPAVQEQAHFGLGNTQFFKGHRLIERSGAGAPPGLASIETTILFWRESIAHFEAALALNPGNKHARENRDQVKRRLEDLLRQRQQQDDQQQPAAREASEPPDSQPPFDRPRGEEPPEGPDQPPPPGPPGEGDRPDTEPPEQPGSPDRDDAEQPMRPGEEKDPAADIEPIPGETPEEYARRILTENADFQGRPLPPRHHRFARPDKDW